MMLSPSSPLNLTYDTLDPSITSRMSRAETIGAPHPERIVHGIPRDVFVFVVPYSYHWRDVIIARDEYRRSA